MLRPTCRTPFQKVNIKISQNVQRIGLVFIAFMYSLCHLHLLDMIVISMIIWSLTIQLRPKSSHFEGLSLPKAKVKAKLNKPLYFIFINCQVVEPVNIKTLAGFCAALLCTCTCVYVCVCMYTVIQMIGTLTHCRPVVLLLALPRVQISFYWTSTENILHQC